MKQKINNDNIFLDQPSGELTFGKIFKVLKCSLLRMLVYLLVACVIASSIALVVTVTNKTDPSVSTTLQYTHKGIDTGLGPDKKPMSVDRIKSTYVLNTAINESGITDVEERKLNPSTLAPHIKMVGVIPHDIYAKIEDLKAQANTDKNVNEELSKLVYFPAEYTLSFDAFTDFNLTEEQATLLLDNIIKAYQRDWNATYYPAPNVSTAVFEQILAPGPVAYEYVDYKEQFDKSVEQLTMSINHYANTSFVSEQTDTSTTPARAFNVSYTSLMYDLNLIKKDIDVYNSYVLINQVYQEVNNVKSPLLVSKEIYEKKLANLKDSKTDIENQIKLINEAMKNSSSIITRPDGSTETVRNFPEAFNEWQKRLMKNSDDIAKCNDELADINRKLALIPSIPTSAEHLTRADAMLDNISTQFISLVNKSQKFVEDYQDNGIITEDISRTTLITRSNRSSVSNKVILVIFLLGAVIAIIAAISVTVTKQKVFAFKKRAESKAVAEAEAPAEAVDVVDSIANEDESSNDEE